MRVRGQVIRSFLVEGGRIEYRTGVGMGEDRLERRPEARAFSVEALLQHVRDGKIRIPEFQRPLRWRANHVLDLFDSVYRGFPVGDLLLFKRAADASTVHVGSLHIRAPAVPDAYFVVDGQQRITALAGAMLHPEPRPRGDIYAVWFDMAAERFVIPTGEPPAHLIPVNVVGDSFALLTWLNEWPFRTQRPDLVQRAIGLGKALREYQIPAYIVEGASDQVLRLIFKRVNTSGVGMEETDIFTALFGVGESRPIESACARIETAAGFGVVPGDYFLQCLKAIEGLDVRYQVTEGEVTKLDPRAVERTEAAILRVFRFLSEDAGIIHVRLLPDPLPLVVLARFFDLHQRPVPRARVLLSRWLWRLLTSSTPLSFDDVARVQGDVFARDLDELSRVEGLLESVAGRLYIVPTARLPWRHDRLFHLCSAVAVVQLHPRDPESGEVLERDAIRMLLESASIDDVFVPVGGQIESPAAYRLLVSSPSKLGRIPSAPLPILESHGLDPAAAAALGRGDIDTFVARRTVILDQWFRRFFAARTGADDGDRPPIAELIRRVDRALTAA
jgi:hypothetical protein